MREGNEKKKTYAYFYFDEENLDLTWMWKTAAA